MRDARKGMTRGIATGILLWITVGFASLLSGQQNSNFVVIVNAENPVTSLDKGTIAKMFQEKIKSWPDWDERVNPVDLDSRSEVREAFTNEVHGKRVSAIVSYWQRVVFSGRGKPPAEKDTEEEVIEHVSSSPGGIGYVSVATRLPDAVKAVTVTD